MLVLFTTCLTSCSTREMTPKTPASRSVMEFAHVLSSRNSEKKFKNMQDTRMSAFMGTNQYFIDTFLGNSAGTYSSDIDYMASDEYDEGILYTYAPYEMLGIKLATSAGNMIDFSTELDIETQINFISEISEADTTADEANYATIDLRRALANIDINDTDTTGTNYYRTLGFNTTRSYTHTAIPFEAERHDEMYCHGTTPETMAGKTSTDNFIKSVISAANPDNLPALNPLNL